MRESQARSRVISAALNVASVTWWNDEHPGSAENSMSLDLAHDLLDEALDGYIEARTAQRES